MRYIFRYTPEAQKKLSALLKKKLPKSEPWLHVAVKTWSQRNPWSGAVVYIWDTRQVIYEHRFKGDAIKTEDFTKAKGWQRALDNRQPLVGGRKDVNEYFEFGDKFDASKGSAFDGKNRKEFTPLYKRRSAKQEPKPATEAQQNELSDAMNNGGVIDLSQYAPLWFEDVNGNKYAVIQTKDFNYLTDETGEMLDGDDNFDQLIEDYELKPIED